MTCSELPADCAAIHVLPMLAEATMTRDGQWRARCPGHDDRVASLSLGIGNRGQRIVYRCHAGCSSESVRTAMIRAGIPAGCLGSYARKQESDCLDRAALAAILESDRDHGRVRLEAAVLVYGVDPGDRQTLLRVGRRIGVSRATVDRWRSDAARG